MTIISKKKFYSNNDCMSENCLYAFKILLFKLLCNFVNYEENIQKQTGMYTSC